MKRNTSMDSKQPLNTNKDFQRVPQGNFIRERQQMTDAGKPLPPAQKEK